MRRYLLPPPRRADRTILPAALAALLVAMVAAQMTLTGDVELPEAGAVGGVGAGAPIARPVRVAVPPVLTARSVFAPDTVAALDSGGEGGIVAPPDPLGGAVIAGTVQVGRARYAVVQSPGGGSARVPLGGRINGWRLIGFADGGVRLRRGGEAMTAMFGGRASALASQAATPEEGQ